MKKTTTPRKQRHARIRAKVKGTSDAPRLFVFKSNKYTYAQLIDDAKGSVVLASVELKDLNNLAKEKQEEAMSRKVSNAYKAGLLIAKYAKDKNIAKVVFDRGGYKYHGRVKGVAEGARAGGLKF